MDDTYKAAANVSNVTLKPLPGKKGKANVRSGVHQARGEIIKDKLMGSGDEMSIFDDVVAAANRDFEKKLNGWIRSGYGKDLASAGDKVLEYFDGHFATDEKELEPMNTEAAEIMKQAVEDAFKTINGEMKQLVNNWESYEALGRR